MPQTASSQSNAQTEAQTAASQSGTQYLKAPQPQPPQSADTQSSTQPQMTAAVSNTQPQPTQMAADASNAQQMAGAEGNTPQQPQVRQIAATVGTGTTGTESESSQSRTADQQMTTRVEYDDVEGRSWVISSTTGERRPLKRRTSGGADDYITCRDPTSGREYVASPSAAAPPVWVRSIFAASRPKAVAPPPPPPALPPSPPPDDDENPSGAGTRQKSIHTCILACIQSRILIY